jgi:class 3 adenylate cyclase
MRKNLSLYYFTIIFFSFITFGFQVDKKALTDKAKQLLATLKEQVKNNQYAEATQTSVILAEVHQELGQASQAATYFKNAIGYAEKSKQKRLIALAYEKEGDFLLAHIDLNKKIKNYQTANKLYQESQDTVGMASTLKKLAKYHFEAKFFAKVPAYSQVLLDNAEEYALSSFEELSHYKALIISYIRLGKIQEVKEYLTLWKNIKKEGLTSISYNPDTDFDEEILAKEFDEALAKAKPQIQQLVYQEQDFINATSKTLRKSLVNNDIKKPLSELEQKAIESKWQKDIIAKQQEIVQLEEEKNQRLYFGIIASLLAVGITVIALVSRQIANRKLEKKNKQIEEQKKVIEEEKKKAETLLLNILPKEVAEELKEKGYAAPRHYDMVTVLFTDFKGFSQIAERLSPHEIVDRLNFFFQNFDEIASKHNLEKIKTIGDAYMCAGGIPNENSTNPIDAVRAGLEIQEFMRQWNLERLLQGEPTFELRLGINTGPLVAGVIGKNKFAYDIWGDTVNLASRMESSGEIGKVNISQSTYEWVRHQFVCTYRGQVHAKNKGEINMYFVEYEIAS